MEKVGVVFPNQASFGTHVNIAGAAVARHAKNRDAAQSRFLEYLASDQAQAYFADGNNEWPAVPQSQGRQSGACRRWAVSRAKRSRSPSSA